MKLMPYIYVMPVIVPKKPFKSLFVIDKISPTIKINCKSSNFKCFGFIVRMDINYYRGRVRMGAMGAGHPHNFESYITYGTHKILRYIDKC